MSSKKTTGQTSFNHLTHSCSGLETKCFVDLVNYMQPRTNRLGNYEPINIDCKSVAQATDSGVGILKDRCNWIVTAPVFV